MKILSWKTALRLIAGLSLLIAIGWVYFEPGFEPLLAILGGVAAFITSFFVNDGAATAVPLPAEVSLYEVDCGQKGIDLANQRLRVSNAFGAYFAGFAGEGTNLHPPLRTD